jgi:hypothetical protein
LKGGFVMSFKEFLRKACTVGLSASMLFSFSPSQIKAEENANNAENTADTINVGVRTGEGKLVDITRPNGGNIRIQLFSDSKYSKGLKQRLIDYVVDQLETGEKLYLRYIFTDAEGNLKETSDWKEYSDALNSMVAEEEGKYDIRYAIVSGNSESSSSESSLST